MPSLPSEDSISDRDAISVEVETESYLDVFISSCCLPTLKNIVETSIDDVPEESTEIFDESDDVLQASLRKVHVPGEAGHEGRHQGGKVEVAGVYHLSSLMTEPPVRGNR